MSLGGGGQSLEWGDHYLHWMPEDHHQQYQKKADTTPLENLVSEGAHKKPCGSSPHRL